MLIRNALYRGSEKLLTVSHIYNLFPTGPLSRLDKQSLSQINHTYKVPVYFDTSSKRVIEVKLHRHDQSRKRHTVVSILAYEQRVYSRSFSSYPPSKSKEDDLSHETTEQAIKHDVHDAQKEASYDLEVESLTPPVTDVAKLANRTLNTIELLPEQAHKFRTISALPIKSTSRKPKKHGKHKVRSTKEKEDVKPNPDFVDLKKSEGFIQIIRRWFSLPNKLSNVSFSHSTGPNLHTSNSTSKPENAKLNLVDRIKILLKLDAIKRFRSINVDQLWSDYNNSLASQEAWQVSQLNIYKEKDPMLSFLSKRTKLDQSLTSADLTKKEKLTNALSQKIGSSSQDKSLPLNKKEFIFQPLQRLYQWIVSKTHSSIKLGKNQAPKPKAISKLRVSSTTSMIDEHDIKPNEPLIDISLRSSIHSYTLYISQSLDSLSQFFNRPGHLIATDLKQLTPAMMNEIKILQSSLIQRICDRSSKLKPKTIFGKILACLLILFLIKVFDDTYLSKTEFAKEPFMFQEMRYYRRIDWDMLMPPRILSILSMDCWLHISSLVDPGILCPTAKAFGLRVEPLYQKFTKDPPQIWTVRMDIPRTIVDPMTVHQEERTLVPRGEVHPVSPNYKGIQILWVVIRKWESGQWVCRIMSGRQIGGDVSVRHANLIPPITVYRPAMLNNWMIRPMELDRCDQDPHKFTYNEMIKRYYNDKMSTANTLGFGGKFDLSTRRPVGELVPLELKWDTYGVLVDPELESDPNKIIDDHDLLNPYYV